jgi:PhnB protein
MEINKTFFAPRLYIRSDVTNIGFYATGLQAIELRRWSNNDGTLHVAELSINGAIFHLREESSLKPGRFSPEKHSGTTAAIGLFVPDVDACINRAIAAGATEISPAKDYDYGY